MKLLPVFPVKYYFHVSAFTLLEMDANRCFVKKS